MSSGAEITQDEMLSLALPIETIHQLHTVICKSPAGAVIEDMTQVLEHSRIGNQLQNAVQLSRALHKRFLDSGNISGVPGFSLRNNYKKWLSKDVALLNSLVSDNFHSWEEIANSLGRTVRAVKWKYHGTDQPATSNDLYNKRYADAVLRSVDSVTLSTEGAYLLQEVLKDSDNSQDKVLLSKVRERYEAVYDPCPTPEPAPIPSPQENLEKNEPEALTETPEPENIATMETALETTKPSLLQAIGTQLGTAAKKAGVTAGGAAIATLVNRAVNETCLKLGVPAETVENQVFQAIVQMAMPALLRLGCSKIPGVQDVKLIDKMLLSAQNVAISRTTGAVVDKLIGTVTETIGSLMSGDGDIDLSKIDLDGDDEEEG